MTDTAIDNSEAIRDWASDWADKYDQSWTTESLSSYIGKVVDAKTDPDDTGAVNGFVARVVGYSADVLSYQPDPESEERAVVYRYSFLSDEGLQLALLAGMVVSEGSDDG